MTQGARSPSRDARILLTGATGMVGRRTAQLLAERGYTRVLTPSRAELDLLDANDVSAYFERERPEYVLMVAARVGGIAANMSDPVGFLDENMRITLNLFSACRQFSTTKNLFLGSSCIYPKETAQPIPEAALLTGTLEPTNEGYALAKIAGLKLARFYHEQYGLLTVCPMPSNIYGTGDHFDLQRSHVLSALVRRFVDAYDTGAASVTLWGTGRARREFLHVDDAAEAILFFLERVETSEHVNVGPGTDISIRELAMLIAGEVGYEGQIQWDATKPDGMLRKCLDVTRSAELGYRATVSLVDGVRRTISEYKALKAQGAVLL